MISVVMPVYNVEKSLNRAVRSVLDQTFREIELILVNDGSTDSSGEMCDTFAEQDDRVIVVHKENGGLSSARNAGIDKASKEYITFIDSDDYYELNLFEMFLNKRRQETDLFVFNVRRIGSQGTKELTSTEEITFDSERAIRYFFELKGADFYAWNKIYLRKLFQEIRYPEGHLYEDIVPSYLIAKKAANIQFTNDIGYNYIENQESIVNASFNSKQYDNVSQRVLLLEYVRSDYPILNNAAIEKLVDGFLSTGYKIAGSKKNTESIQYYKRLKSDIIQYKDYLNEIPLPKKIALQLLKMNLNLYRVMYKMYLGK